MLYEVITAFENDVEALAEVRRLVDFLPLNNRDKPPVRPFFDDVARSEVSLDSLVPDNPNTPYDMHELIQKVADEGDFYEIQRDFANVITSYSIHYTKLYDTRSRTRRTLILDRDSARQHRK